MKDASKYNLEFHYFSKSIIISFRDGLKENGVIIVKENITSADELELDKQDSSVTRSMKMFKQIFDRANLECYRVVKQQNFPKGLYSVYTFVLKPKDRKCNSDNINSILKNQEKGIETMEDNINDKIKIT